MAYNDISLAKCPESCQEGRLAKASPLCPGSCPLVAEAVRLGWTVVCRSPALSSGLDSLTVNVGKAVLPDSEAGQVLRFREYRERLGDKVVIVRNRADSSVVKVVRQADSSRYFPAGRGRMKAKIRRRMGGFYSCHGLLVSLTFDPKLIGKEDAWRQVGEFGRRWLDNVNGWRRRAGMSKVRGIKVLEVQPGTGYPHLHYGFPRLKWLADYQVLKRYWAYAAEGVDWKYRDSFSPVGYVCKYVSKLEGWSDEALAEIWVNRTRLYSMSRDYYLVGDERRLPEWCLLRTAKVCAAGVWLRALVGEYDTVLGANDLALEVFLGSGKG